MKLSRRGFLGLCAGGAVAASAIPLLSFRNVIDEIEVSHTIIRIPDLPAQFASYRISVLSDLHLGPFVPNQLIEKAVLISNSFEPDITVLAGDYIGIPDSIPGLLFSDSRNKTFQGLKYTEMVRGIFETLTSILKKAVAPDGVFAVLGNHDNWHNPHVCCSILGSNPIRFLINEVVTIQRENSRLDLLGVDDLWTGIPRIPGDFTEPKSSQIRLIISHNPDFLVETVNRHGAIFDLGIAGHTHGGQIKLGPLGAVAGYNIRNPRFGEGLAEHNGCQIYTSRGVGVVDLPYRIGCPPEVAILELQNQS